MALKEDIIYKVKTILDEKFDVTDVTYVPRIDDSKLTFGNTGLKFEATVLYIDMRGSTELLGKHNRTVVAKIHMAYFHTIVKIANALGGNVRSFNGDSTLVFFQGTTKAKLSTAVEAAMKIKYMLSDSVYGINNLLAKYSEINFGIGIDDGHILCTKIGTGGEHNRDLFWVGHAVNKSTVLSDKAKLPNAIYISSYVYSNLTDELLYKDQNAAVKINMWSKSTINYNGEEQICYYNSYHWGI
jgi:adenylate cyclase